MTHEAAEANTSILNSVKAQVGVHSDDTSFDQILILDINTVFSMLNQLGVGPDEVYFIEGPENTWDEFITQVDTEMVKTYMALRVRELFDPPTGTQVAQALRDNIAEFAYRLHVQACYLKGREDAG